MSWRRLKRDEPQLKWTAHTGGSRDCERKQTIDRLVLPAVLVGKQRLGHHLESNLGFSKKYDLVTSCNDSIKELAKGVRGGKGGQGRVREGEGG